MSVTHVSTYQREFLAGGFKNQSHSAIIKKPNVSMSSPKNYTNQVVALDTERHGASGNVLINAKKDVLKSTSFFVFY